MISIPEETMKELATVISTHHSYLCQNPSLYLYLNISAYHDIDTRRNNERIGFVISTHHSYLCQNPSLSTYLNIFAYHDIDTRIKNEIVYYGNLYSAFISLTKSKLIIIRKHIYLP